MRRAQVYFDEQLWGALHARARRDKTTVSNLVRLALHERYLYDREQRRTAMQQFVGVRKAYMASENTANEIGRIRRGFRLERLGDR